MTEIIEVVIKKLLKNINPNPNAFTSEYYQTFKEDLLRIIFKLFKEIKDRDTTQIMNMKLTSLVYIKQILQYQRPRKIIS